jgi:hypothetical protein
MSMKFIISAAVMFIMAWALSFVVHGVLLGPDYAAGTGMRPPAEAQPLMGYMILAMALFAIAFAWVYERGRENKPWLAQGLRYGIAIAFLTVIPTYLIYHVVTPVPLALALKQIVYDTIRILLMGVVVAWIYR